MSILDGQRVRALESNAAWASKTADNTLTGQQTLNHAGSGAIVSDVQQSINDNIDDISNLQTLSGVADGSTDLGVFPGTTIPDGQTIKDAVSSLETAVELRELSSNKGAASGYAPLDGTSKVPAAYLPSYVDDVLEFANLAAFPVTGESDKIYLAIDTGKVYRWTGSVYVEVSPSDVNSVNGATGIVVLDTDDIAEGSNLYFTDARARTAVVDDAIVDAVTNKAPSQNAVFDALALKENIASTANDTTSGSNVTLASVTTTHVRLTNASLVSVDMIPAGSNLQRFILINASTVAVIINNETGATAANRILTGSGANLTLQPDANLLFTYDSTTARWRIVGGSGGGSVITANRAAISDGSGAIIASVTTAAEVAFLSGVSSSVQTQLNGKEPTVTGAASTITSANLTASRALESDGSGKVSASAVTSTELSRLTGVTSSIQAQLDSKSPELGVVINYVTNYGAELNTSGWAAYADAAGSLPVDGTGGSPTVTWTRNTAGTHLRGNAHFLFKKDAADRQGEGVSYQFTIDDADRGKPLQISVDYKIGTGTYSGGTPTTDSDLTCYIYDITNGVVIQPSGFKLDGAVSGVNYNVKATFQADSVSTSYRLIFHVATTSASDFTVVMDRIIVSPVVTSSGVAMTDWIAYTPTLVGTGTNTSVSFFYRRVGDSIYVKGRANSGTPTAVQQTIGLPAGLSIDTSKLATPSQGAILGTAFTNIDTTAVAIPASTRGPFIITNQNGVTNAVMISSVVDKDATATDTIFNADLANTNNTAGRAFTVDFMAPILGWSSNTQVSADTDTRIVAAKYTIANGVTGTAAAPFNFATKVYDTHNAVTTGAAWKFTAPVPGFYRVSVQLYFGAASRTYLIYKNGSSDTVLGSGIASQGIGGGSATLQLVAGDFIELRSNLSATTDTTTVAGNYSICIERISGASQIASSETIAARIGGDPASAASGAPVIFTAASYDTHGGYNTTTGRYTCSAPGLYEMSGQISSANAAVGLFLYKNAASDVKVGSTDSNGEASFFGAVRCVAGDIIDLRPNATLDADSTSVLYIKRIGN